MLHSDFYAMQEKLKELVRGSRGQGSRRLIFPVPILAEFAKKVEASRRISLGGHKGFDDNQGALDVTIVATRIVPIYMLRLNRQGQS